MPAPSRIARHGRKTVVLLLGAALVAAGVALLVLPGPGLVVILVGLALLSSEFDVARRWRNRLLREVSRRYHQARARVRATPPTDRPESSDSLRDRPM